MPAKRPTSEDIRGVIATLPPIFEASAVVERLPNAPRELIDQVLARMVRAGDIDRLARGTYQQRPKDDEVSEKFSVLVAPLAPAAATHGRSNGATSANLANLIWSTADEVLRGDYKPHEYGSVILPFTVMRRIDCVLAPTKAKVLEAVAKHAKSDIDLAFFMTKATGGLKFWNTSKFDFPTLANDSSGVKKNILDYVGGFSDSIRDIFDYYKVIDLINDLARKHLLFLLVQKFAKVNLTPKDKSHPQGIDNADMGQAFEELIRRFSEQSNETAGEHYTPRDAIRLAVELMFATDEDPTLAKEQRIVTLYDPTAGTGGMLSVAEEHLKDYNKSIVVRPYGQELNEQTYAICKADMLIKGQDISKIVLGNTLSNDAFSNEKFDYMLSNPPYGVDWKKAKEDVEAEHKRLGFKGRFGPGLPRISDGQMLFLLHLISKMHPKDRGETSRVGIVMNGSPLLSGGAGSGESEIRRYIFENDLLEAIVALPTDMFYNTNISTYIWILSNNKEARRRGKVHLINATDFSVKMRRNLGNKRREFTRENIATIVKEYGAFKESNFSKILPNTAFGYNTIVVEQPLRLSFQVTSQRLAALANEPLLTKNGVNFTDLTSALMSIGDRKFLSRGAFLKVLDAALKRAKITLKAPQYKAVWQTLSERDAAAEICTNSKGEPEPDPELRDTENISLDEDLHAYLVREVLPHVPDAWADESKTKVGYEIPFGKYFFQYKPLRAIPLIEADLSSVSKRISAALGGF